MSSVQHEIKLQIPCMAEYVGVVRLMISGIAARMNFTVEDIEDIKIAVSEACTNAVQYAYDQPDGHIDICCRVSGQKLDIEIQDHGVGFDVNQKLESSAPSGEPSENKMGLGLGLTFIQSLMDEASFESSKDGGTTVRMSKSVRAENPVKG